MNEVTQENLDQVRKMGFRPVAVACFVANKKLLMVYKAEHKLWQLPQGGIENGETIGQAIRREMKEELGQDIGTRDKDFVLLVESLLEFPAQMHGSRELKTDEGSEIKMKGKKYFFIAVKNKLKNLDVRKTEFDGYDWLDFESARKLAEEIYQAGKKRITLEALNLLKERKLIK
jgi:8-oxo-dGTP pyrophosphatase MutT (NUDIX family)